METLILDLVTTNYHFLIRDQIEDFRFENSWLN